MAVKRKPEQRQITASELKAHCAAVIERVARRHETVVITRRGRLVAKLIPIEADRRPSLFGALRGTVTIHADILEPIAVTWEAMEE